MKGRRFDPSPARDAVPRERWKIIGAIMAVLLAIGLIGKSGCIWNCVHPESELSHAVAPSLPPRPPDLKQVSRPLSEDQHLLEGSGVTVWAEGFEGQLIAGLDEVLYEPYRSSVIKRVQQALRDRGIYAGPINGILDRPTMKSIFAFQESQYILPRCGIPTPHTRKMLEQGSHTDLRF